VELTLGFLAAVAFTASVTARSASGADETRDEPMKASTAMIPMPQIIVGMDHDLFGVDHITSSGFKIE
jgi:hypothetical protein